MKLKEHYKPTLQTKFGEKGNCTSAVYATLFDIDIDDLPVFENPEDETNWLKQYGKFIIYVAMNDKKHFDDFHNSLLITCIKSKNSNPKVNWHAVISQGQNIIFDPLVGEVNIPITKEMKATFGIIGDIHNIT